MRRRLTARDWPRSSHRDPLSRPRRYHRGHASGGEISVALLSGAVLVVAFREPALLDDLGLLVALAWIALPVSLVAFFSIVPHRIIRAVLRAVVVTIMFAPVLIVGHGGIAPVPVLLTWILPFERLFPGQSFVSFSVTGIVTLFVFGIVDEWREG